MLTLASSEAREGGRLTRQFCRWTRDISAAADWAFLLGAIVKDCFLTRGYSWVD